MKLEKIVPYLWKTPIFGLALYAGVVIGDYLAALIGLEAPDAFLALPSSLLALYLLVISPILLASLLFLCWFLTGNFIAHWLTLSLLTWGIYSFGTTASSASKGSLSGFSPYVLIVFFFASFIGVGTMVRMFPDHYKRRDRFLIRR